MTLYRTLVALIKNGRTDGLREKIDVLYAVGSLTTEQYNELIAMLDADNETA